MSRPDPYRYLREHRPDLLRACVEVGSVIACALPDADRTALATQTERRMVEVLANLLRERVRS